MKHIRKAFVYIHKIEYLFWKIHEFLPSWQNYDILIRLIWLRMKRMQISFFFLFWECRFLIYIHSETLIQLRVFWLLVLLLKVIGDLKVFEWDLKLLSQFWEYEKILRWECCFSGIWLSYVAAWMGREFGGEWITYAWLNPILSTWKYHTLLISYTTIQNPIQALFEISARRRYTPRRGCARRRGVPRTAWRQHLTKGIFNHVEFSRRLVYFEGKIYCWVSAGCGWPVLRHF